MAANRSAGRNVHIYDAKDTNTVLGGLILTHGVTNASFYPMVETICLFDQIYSLRDECGKTIERDNHPLQPGNYYIVTNGSVTVSNEVPSLRTISMDNGIHVQSFRDSVRDRDRRCVITGRPALDADYGIYFGFQATHIIPLSSNRIWTERNYGRWITIPPATESAGAMNSVQNGLLLDNTIHTLFSLYIISINPDDNYKIVCFRADSMGIAGKYLDQQFLDDPRRPVDPFLRWHFRQAILANMKGAGEPLFEPDFSPGSDMMAVQGLLYQPD